MRKACEYQNAVSRMDTPVPAGQADGSATVVTDHGDGVPEQHPADRQHEPDGHGSTTSTGSSVTTPSTIRYDRKSATAGSAVETST